MPELPDVDVYVTRIAERIKGASLVEIRIASPFLLRSYQPTASELAGGVVTSVRRIGKRVAIGLDSDAWIVIHLMVAGRLHWHDEPPSLAAKNRLASFDFSSGHLLLTESGHKKRASLHLVASAAELEEHDPGGIEPLDANLAEFAEALRHENRTLKRALTNPRTFSGIGNAYSDEILHAAGLSPIRLTSKLDDDEVARLHDATQTTLIRWRDELMQESSSEFPKKVTAFRDGMAVHGRFGKPCPVCDAPVQRIRYKSNETNYCPACQTGGKILADRSLSRLLKDNWPSSLD